MYCYPLIDNRQNLQGKLDNHNFLEDISLAKETTHKKLMMKKMNHNRRKFAVAYDSQNKEIYVFDGCNGNELKSCEKYSIESNQWTEIAPL